ncbi:hypothetical protein [Microbacterium sp. NIBRBAC000506063]|uniref:hypothetical protein n=1 Tax=Microbacterium sp. NIBRBAC000506063 TaxID=2734618 RepID=UPI001BB4FF18|nr:hypothetical protein [Microbacterium sp. NIBRBAC000506063]QTV80987.1 hypothetical protein KAE78_14840 [Microbacterium sp. NIBRBAC000506063]
MPAELRDAIAEVERTVGDGRAHWTLTWLEGRPVAELDAGWEVLLDAAGEVVARPWQD